jgi:hypothetical protein
MLDTMRKKHREVNYFLRQLELVARREVSDPEEFEFLLSAVLSAARSITVLLKDRRYGAWFEAWRSGRTAREQELLEFMRVQRNAEVHRDGAELETTLEWIPIIEIPANNRSHPAYGFHSAAPPGTPVPQVGLNVRQFMLGGTRIEASVSCREFSTLLANLVANFEAAHPGA